MDEPQARPRYYIISVGASLIRKLDYQFTRVPEEDYDAVLETSDYTPLNLARHENFFGSVTKKLGNLSEAGLARGRSAELSALYCRPENAPFAGKRRDRAVLIGTRTEEGEVCVEALARLLRQKCENAGFEPDRIETVFPRNLGSAKQPAFATDGLVELLEECVDRVSAHRFDYDVVLLPNGGYKTLGAYLTLLGLIEKLPLWYIYEDSDTLLELPGLPVGLDMLAWTRQRHLIGLLRGTEVHQAANIRIAPEFRGMFKKEGGRYKLSLLGEFLDRRFREQEWSTPLRRASQSTSLLDYLDNSEGIPFKAMFERLIAIGDRVWKGDRLPEMADHAIRHHYDLFDLAERVLLPLFWWWKDTQRSEEDPYRKRFLDAHELFTLLGAVYLHDCGHVVGSYYRPDSKVPVPLFPGQVREHHHVLAYLRLRAISEEYPDRYMSREIGEALLDPDLPGAPWVRQIESENPAEDRTLLWERYLRAIATLGVYHRRATTLIEFAGREYHLPAGLSVDDLEDSTERDRPESPRLLLPIMSLKEVLAGARPIPPKRLRLLACLLRAIDCLDQQSARTGDHTEVRFQEALLQTQIQELKAAESELRSGFETDVASRLEEMLGRKGGGRVGDDKILREAEAVVARADGSIDPATRVLARQYVRLVRSREFKEVQLDGKHLSEKERVKAVRIRPEWEPGKPGAPIRFTVEVELYDNDAGSVEALRAVCEYIHKDLFAAEVVDGFSELDIEFVMRQAGRLSES